LKVPLVKIYSYNLSGREKYSQPEKPTVRIKGASSYYRDRKPSELASVIKGISYAGIKTSCKTKAASSVEAEKSQKLKELSQLIRAS
jgi:hypothetical protein